MNPKPGTRNPEPGTRNPKPGTRNPIPHSRPGSVLAEFVVFLPFVFFIIAMIFHFGVSNLRKQRTIVAARFATDAAVRGIGNGNPNDYSQHPLSGNRYARRQAFPDPQDHFLGLFDAREIQPRFVPRLGPDMVGVVATSPDDGLSGFRQEIERRDAGQPPVTDVTRTFWEPLAATDQIIGNDLDFRRHVYARGTRIQADYRPNGPYYQRLQGPLASHYYRETGAWAFARPDMWWELTHSDSGLAELEEFFYAVARDPQMGRTGEAFFRWFRH